MVNLPNCPGEGQVCNAKSRDLHEPGSFQQICLMIPGKPFMGMAWKSDFNLAHANTDERTYDSGDCDESHESTYQEKSTCHNYLHTESLFWMTPYEPPVGRSNYTISMWVLH